ncbi:MAG: CBS domain-containing protein [Gammaproteobacteria bacterium]|nr:CBS domain-containing protein [Gammaproteobacteria bacterium]MCP4090727.1 CBS domain-containing protein [Gammaproteobacteria bacterium]MCP4277154.1 CBS domain-containing protein [Gammaproteobacteria bacterium]MCP4831712.1 CBS domain-containing protein [Gammaproteobacteria bacterium]MCP4928036.1 CBS domain-containing protein [Gammaproteobacteria bacterium]
MQTASEILRIKGHDIWSVKPDDTILIAIQLMADHEVGALLVMDQEKLVGIVTERDYTRKVALEDRSSKNALVKEIMSERVLCANPEQTVKECMALMSDKRARHLPILDHKKVIGIISIGDLVKSIIREQQFEIEALQHYITH